MSYLLTLHQDATLTLATTERTVPAQHVQALESALDLAAALQTLTSSARDAAAQAQQAACEQGHRDGFAAGLAQATRKRRDRLQQRCNRWRNSTSTSAKNCAAPSSRWPLPWCVAWLRPWRPIKW